MLRSALLVITATLTLPATVLAQAKNCAAAAQSSISTDRPQITNSSIVIPCGSLQFENGFQETTNAGARSFDLPETSVRFGLTAKTELRFGVPNYLFHTDAGSGFATGFSDLVVGFKQQLGPRAGFDFSLIPSVSMPTGAGRISSQGYDPSIQLPWSRALSKNWTAAGMFSVAWPSESGQRNATGQSSLYFDRQLLAPWDAYVEYSGSFPQRGGPEHTIDFGTAYKPTSHQQLDLHCSFGLSTTTANHTIGFGYSVSLQALHAH